MLKWGCIIYCQIESVIRTLQIKVKNHDGDTAVRRYRYCVGTPEKEIKEFSFKRYQSIRRIVKNKANILSVNYKRLFYLPEGIVM